MPREIQAGLSISFKVSFPSFPAPLWSATLHMISVSSKIEITAKAEGNDFVFSATATESAKWAPGQYSALIRVSNEDDVHQPFIQRLHVLPDLAAIERHDPRTDAEKALAAIQDTLANRATSDQLKLSFGGRSLEKTPLLDLLKLEARFIRMLNNEHRKKAGRSLFKINKIRMK